MIFADKNFIKFLVVFTIVFCALYFGAKLVTGMATPGGFYSPFVEKYFNVASWVRSSLIAGTKILLSFFGTKTIRRDEYVLSIINGPGIRIVYSCLGFGVMSFWTAYVSASAGSIRKMLAWLFGGLALLWIINVARLALVLQTAQSGKRFPFGWDHHTWFNIIAYIFILLMIFFYQRYGNREKETE